MIPKKQTYTRKPNTGVRGALLTSVILPVWFAFIPDSAGQVAIWRMELSLCAVAVLTLSFGFLANWVLFGKLLGILGCILTYVTLFPGLGFDPISTLIASVSIIWFGWLIYDYQPMGRNLGKVERDHQLHERSLWALRALLLLVAVFHLMDFQNKGALKLSLSLSTSIALILSTHWILNTKNGKNKTIALFLISLSFALLWWIQFKKELNPFGTEWCAICIGGLGLYFIQKIQHRQEEQSHWWDAFF
jgi:hypothetical protein